MAKKIKIGVVGCGAIAQHGHLPYYGQHKNIQIFAADESEDRLKEICKSFNIERVYKNYEEMLRNEKLDGVSVCVPNHLHAKVTIRAAKQGIHVLCEKPMALKVSDAKRMVETCRQNAVILMVNFTSRFCDGPQKIKQLLDQHRIGEIHSIRIRFVHSGPYNNWAKSKWFYDPAKAGGGALMDMGVHAIDICHFLIGPVTSVIASVANLSKNIPVEDSAMMLVEFGKNRKGIIEVGWTGAGGFAGIEVCGSKGSIAMDLRKGLYVTQNRSHPNGSVDFKETKLNCELTARGWERAINEFISHLSNGTSPSSDGKAGLMVMRVVEAAYKSVKSDQMVCIR